MADPGLELRVGGCVCVGGGGGGGGGVVVLVSQPAFLSSVIFAFVTQTRAGRGGKETRPPP